MTAAGLKFDTRFPLSALAGDDTRVLFGAMNSAGWFISGTVGWPRDHRVPGFQAVRRHHRSLLEFAFRFRYFREHLLPEAAPNLRLQISDVPGGLILPHSCGGLAARLLRGQGFVPVELPCRLVSGENLQFQQRKIRVKVELQGGFLTARGFRPLVLISRTSGLCLQI